MYWSDLVLAVVVLLFSLLVGRTVSRKLGVSHVPMWVLTAILIGLGLLFHVEQSPFFIPSDATEYRTWGYALAEFYRSEARAPVLDLRPDIWPGKGVWAVLISIFAYFFGPIELTFVVMSAAMTSLAMVFLQKAALHGQSPRNGRFVMVLFSTTPALLVFGSGPLREAPFWLGVSLGALGITYAWDGKAIKAGIFLGAGVLFLLAIRPDFGYVVSLSLTCSAALGLVLAIWQVSRSYAIAVGVLQCLHVAAAPTIYLALATPTTILNSGDLAATRRSLSGSQVTSRLQSVDQSIDQSTNKELGEGSEIDLSLLYGSVFEALFGPWPNNVSSIINALAIVATFQFLFVLSLAIVGILLLPNNRKEIVVTILMSTALLILLAIVLTNFGALMRFRTVVSLLLIPTAARVLQELIERFRHRKSSPTVVGPSR